MSDVDHMYAHLHPDGSIGYEHPCTYGIVYVKSKCADCKCQIYIRASNKRDAATVRRNRGSYTCRDCARKGRKTK